MGFNGNGVGSCVQGDTGDWSCVQGDTGLGAVCKVTLGWELCARRHWVGSCVHRDTGLGVVCKVKVVMGFVCKATLVIGVVCRVIMVMGGAGHGGGGIGKIQFFCVRCERSVFGVFKYR